ncbi:MAG: helix-turn-helix domain-containing protein [Polyangiaceae bacterium]
MARPSDPNAKIKLLRAAESEFARDGLDRAKVEAITARAGLSKGAFYLHFQSKEDAFRQLVESVVARMQTLVEQLPCDPAALAELAGMSDEDYLAYWVERDSEIFEFVWANRGVMCLLLEGGRSSSFLHLVEEFSERTRESVKRALAAGVEAGRYRADLDVEIASAFMSGAYDRIARQITRMPKKPDIRAILREAQMFVVRGIGSRELVASLSAKSGEARESQEQMTVRRAPSPGRGRTARDREARRVGGKATR